jgi:hypothetical protein
MSKSLLKRLKRYALDKDMMVTSAVEEAFEEYLKKVLDIQET